MTQLTIALFGHRNIDDDVQIERRLEIVLENLFNQYEHLNFLIGRQGDFDILAASCIRKLQKRYGKECCTLTLMLPYLTAEVRDNQRQFEAYFDEIEICDAPTHFKNAILTRNQTMVNRADLIICYVHAKGGASTALHYAQKQGKTAINLEK